MLWCVVRAAHYYYSHFVVGLFVMKLLFSRRVGVVSVCCFVFCVLCFVFCVLKRGKGEEISTAYLGVEYVVGRHLLFNNLFVIYAAPREVDEAWAVWLVGFTCFG